MTDETIEDLRHGVAALLPQAIERASASYRAFAARAAPEEPRAFSAHHAACKAALSHLDTLLKLARWALGEEGATAHQDDIAALMAEARAALEDADG